MRSPFEDRLTNIGVYLLPSSFSLRYAVPFEDRLRLFEAFAKKERARCQPEGTQTAIRVRIRRSAIFEDGLQGLNTHGPDLKKRIYVEFVNQLGGVESGIDAGGLFKDFWTKLSAIVFNPHYGLFTTTTHDNTM